jgi:hypothetical protein
MKVSTTQFVRSHGRQPRGRGLWMFQFRDSKGVALVTLFDANGTYAEACRKARSMARGYACGVETIEVLP